MLQPKQRGSVLALMAALSTVNTYFCSKYVLGSVSVFRFGFLWYSVGAVCWIVFLIFSGGFRDLKNLSRLEKLILLCFGISETISTLFFFTAIQKIENPAMVSFVGNVGPVLITLGGVLFLKERFSRIEVVGIIIAIAGAFLVTSGGNPSALLTFQGIEYLSGTVIANAFSILLAKAFIKSLSPAMLAFIRSFFLWTSCLIMLLINRESPLYANNLLWIIVAGALLGPFLGSFAAYSALRYIGAGRSVIIQTTKSILILILAWPLLGLWPHGVQLAGGLMTVSGVIVMIVLRERYRS